MPGIDPRLLGDWIQLLASLGVIAGIILLVVDLADMRPPTSSEYSSPAADAASEGAPEEASVEVSATRQSELRVFIAENCPVCHGTRLAGSIGPALSNASLRHLSVEAVSSTILNGYEARGMPAWKPPLTAQEADWIARFLKQDRPIE